MRLLILFSVPLLIGNLFQQAYNMADSMIVGKLLGANSLAAVGSTGAVSFLFFSICNGLGSGGGILTAMCFGAGDGKMVKKALVNSAYIMFMMSLLTGLAGYLAAPSVLNGMGTPDAVYPEALTYMRMSCISVPLVAVYNYASSMLRSLGDSKTPLFFLIFSCILLIVWYTAGSRIEDFGAAKYPSSKLLYEGRNANRAKVHLSEGFFIDHFQIPWKNKIRGGWQRFLPLGVQDQPAVEYNHRSVYPLTAPAVRPLMKDLDMAR